MAVHRRWYARPSAALCLALLIAHGGAAAEPSLDTPIEKVPFIAFDLETTGLSPHRDRVLEIGFVKFQNGKLLDQHQWLINPQGDIPKSAQRVHGLTPEMMAGQPLFAEVYPEFLAAIDGAVLIAHNARFDVSFIREEAARAGLPKPTNPVIDSLALCRKWYPESKTHKLSAMVEMLNIREHGRAHRAVSDSFSAMDVVLIGMRDRGHPATLGDLYKQGKGPGRF